MTILAAGASASISLPAGQFIQVTGGAGVAQVLNMPGASPIALDGDVKIGPFDSARTVSLSSTVALDYSVNENTVGTLTASAAAAVQYGQAVIPIPVAIPSGLRFSSMPFNIRRGLDGSIRHDFDPTSLIAAPTVTYYVNPLTGSNGNAGTSAGAALADLSVALAKVDVDQIIITGLTSDYIAIGAKAWNNTQPNRTISVLNRTGYRFINTQSAGVPTWTVNGTYGNVYQSTVTAANAGSVSDIATLSAPAFSAPGDMLPALAVNVAAVIANAPKGARHLKKVASIAAVAAEAGTWFHDGSTTLYVRAHDDRNLVGDQKMLPMLSSTTNGRWKPSTNGVSLYVENMDFIGGPNAFLSDAASTVTGQVLVFNNCSFQGASSGTGNGLAIKSFSTVYAYRCAGIGNWADGLNYHSFESDGTTPATSPTVYEIECLSYGNGFTGSAGTSDNGSTAHDFVNLVRLNSAHLQGDDATVADINSAQSVNLGVYAAQALTVAAGRQCFKFANSVSAVLDSCYAQAGANDRWLAENTTTTLRHFNSGAVVNGSGGTGVVRSFLG